MGPAVQPKLNTPIARHEANREDLMREATALVERAALELPECSEPVVAGFRATGALSIFMGADPVYQFDPQGRLRRAYVAGALYRSQGTTLARLVRQRESRQTRLLRHDLRPDELAAFFAQMAERLTGLLRALTGNNAKLLQTVPKATDLRPRLAEALLAALQCRLSSPLKK